MSLLLIVLLSYLAGSIPTSIIVGKLLKGIDIRDYGSKNAGATNTLRVLGWKPALVVMVVDVGKGIFATLVIAKLRIDPVNLDSSLVQIMAGLAAICGHIWTVFAGFRGGKGVATAGGMLIALYPWAALICAGIFFLTVLITRYVSVGSMTASASFPLVLVLLHYIFDIPISYPLFFLSLLIGALIIYTHRSNIRRLLNGTENRFDINYFKKWREN